LKDKSYNSQNEKFICNQCTQFEKKLYVYQEILDGNDNFSKSDKIGETDHHVYEKIKPIEKGFTVSDDDDLYQLLSWYQCMQREGQKITFDDLADENFRAIPKMMKYA